MARAAGPRGAPAPDAPAAPPAVVAVVVTRNPGAWLEEGLAALAAQDYLALSVLVVDAGSATDPTARVASVLPDAFVRRLGGDPGFSGAANDALEAVHGATFFLLCHDDVALDPDAVRVMVEEAYRSNAAVVGPKLVSAADPSVLLDVGRAIDRLGGSHTGIEPGEVDQEQHDTVRDTFYVSSAAMLVRADLFGELGGFDPDSFPGSEDLDLCWRARLAGARIVVAPDARARHREAAAERAPGDAPTERELARTRVRSVLTAYSRRTLLWVTPLGLVAAFAGAIGLSVTSRRAVAFANLRAWLWNLSHPGARRDARVNAQRLRRVQDSELHELQAGIGEGSRAFLGEGRGGYRRELLGERGRDALEALGESMRHPAAVAFVAFVVVVILGSRDIFSAGVPEIGTLVPWAGVKDSFAELTSAWRHTGLGSSVAAPPSLGVMGGLGIVLLGKVSLAQTLLVVGAFVVGPVGAFRLGRAIGGSHGAAAVIAVVYGVCAVPRNALANGRLGPLVLYAAAPFVVLLLVRCAGFRSAERTSRRRPLVAVAIVTAAAAAWYPPALLLGFAVGIAFLAASPLVGEASAALRLLGAALVAAIGAAVLLVPWTTTLLGAGGDRAALGAGLRSTLDLGDVLRFESGPNGAGVAAGGLLLAAVAALAIATGPHLTWAVRGWTLAITGYAAAYLPARLAPDALVPAPEAALAVAALGIAIAAGMGTGALAQRVQTKRIGWAPAVGVLAMAGVAVGSLGFLGDAFEGRWHASAGWGDATSFTEDQTSQGEFRILWLGDPAVLPTDPFPVGDDLSYALTRNGPGDAREILRAPETDTDEVVAQAVQTARRGETSRLGRMLAPMGIRYVALALRDGEEGARGRTPADVSSVLGNQLDLARLGAPPGLVLYENASWAPARSVLTGARADAVPVDSPEPLRAAAAVDISSARDLAGGADPAGAVLLAEAYDADWSAEAGGEPLEHGRAFGITNTWTSPERGSVSLSFGGQSRVYLLFLLQLVLWIAAIVWWLRGRERAPKSTRRRQRREERRERAPRRDFIDDLADLGDDVDFWEHG